MKKIACFFLYTFVTIIGTPNVVSACTQTKPSPLEITPFGKNKKTVDVIKFFQNIGNLKIGSRSVNYLLYCELFNIDSISFRDLCSIDSFISQNRQLASKLHTIIQKILETLTSDNIQQTQYRDQNPKIKKLIEELQNILSPFMHLFTEILPIFSTTQGPNLTGEQLREMIVNIHYQNIIGNIIKQTLDSNEIQKLLTFLQNGSLLRICKEIAATPYGFLNLLENIISIHGKTLEKIG
ncbi:MAG: hypothetical protein V1855_00080 [bacterium]